MFVRVKLLCWSFELMTPIACGTIIIQAIFGLICLSLLLLRNYYYHSFQSNPKKKNYRTTPGPGSGPRPMGPARSEMMRAAGCHACSSLVLDHSPMSCIPSLVSTSDKKKDFFLYSALFVSQSRICFITKKTIRLHAKVFFPERSHVQV